MTKQFDKHVSFNVLYNEKSELNGSVDAPVDFLAEFRDRSLSWEALVDSTRKSPENDDKLYQARLPEISQRMAIDFGSFEDFVGRKPALFPKP